MKTKLIWTLALLIGGAAAAQAATSDSLTVTITPSVSYAVAIDTGTGSLLNLGSVALGASTQTVVITTVTINSSYATTGLTLQGSLALAAGGASPWSFSSDTSKVEQDKLAAWAVFTDTSVVSVPNPTTYTGLEATTAGLDSGVIDGTSQPVAATANPAFDAPAGTAGYKNMHSLPSSAVDGPASRSHLWLRFRLPGSTSNTGAEAVTITLTAGAPQ
ncbi:MAG: hypothetical protein KGO96_11575 [Elusimicrobia bacterium]|nr:hypothetical protein [Elusimicrobiota bacterium]MDE2426533.1 hypothetical protein [Elusimicrobiota bacterium]